MRVLPDLPDLQIVPTSSLRPHEHDDSGRAAPLVEMLKRDGSLRNPPIVLPLAGASERYLVLDGANRTTAFRALGLEHALVQVVHPGASQVDVETWNHVLLGVAPEELREIVRPLSGIEMHEAESSLATAELQMGTGLAYLSHGNGRVTGLDAPAEDLGTRIGALDRLVAAYRPHARVERTNARELGHLENAFPGIKALVVFRSFSVQDVVEAASQGLLLPGGLTRFIVSPRALRVNYPLDALSARAPLVEKQQALASWMRERVVQRRVRYYAESTYLFDE